MNLSERPIGIFITDANLVVRSWDAWMAEATGIPEESARDRDLITLFPDLLSRGLIAKFQRVLSDGVNEILAPAFHHYLIPCSPKIASEFFDKMQQRVTIAPLREDESIIGTIVTIEDVTERMDKRRRIAKQLASQDEKVRLHAARALAEDEDEESVQNLSGSLGDPDWRVRKTAAMGVANHGGQKTILSLLKTLRDEHKNPNVLNSVLNVLSMSGIDIISPLLNLLKDPDKDLRIYVALALGEIRDPRASSALIEALRDPDANVRYHSIEALGKLRSPEAVEPLISIAESRDFFLAFPAIDALTSIGEPNVAFRLVPLLEDELLRIPAAEALCQLGDEDVVAPLVSLLNKQGAPSAIIVQALAILHNRYERLFKEATHIEEIVSRLINEIGVQNLLNALEEVNGDGLRELAIVLGWLEGPAVERALTRLLGKPKARKEVIEALVRHGSEVVELLIEQLDSEDLETKQASIMALGRIGDNRSVPHLVRILGQNGGLTIVVAGALAKIGDRQAFDALLEMIGHPDAAVRQSIIASINSLGHPEMAKRAVEILRDPNPFKRESAVKIAGYFGYDECVELLLECCKDPEESVRRAAIEHLPYLDDKRVLPVLVDALGKEAPRIRAAAAQALAQIESRDAYPHLIKALEDADPWVRYYGARSIGRHGYHDAIELLARLAQQDKAQQVRIAAMEALGRIGGARAVSILAPFIETRDRDLARAALKSLGMINHPDAMPPLLAALRSPNSLDRIDALNAIGERGGVGAEGALQWVAAVDSDPRVVKAAINSLEKLKTSESASALVALTADPSRREDAISALAHLGEEQIEPIAQGLSHPQARVRIAVVEVLARMKRTHASELLVLALDDPEPSVRLAAVTALGQLGSRYADHKISVLARTDTDISVRAAAKKALRQ
jgi:HEAT repeat protein